MVNQWYILMDLEDFCAFTFKWIYLSAQEELVGQMVVVTKYFGRPVSLRGASF